MKETFRCEWVRCGKASCGSCPHGPYWYAYHREGPKVKKRYVGKDRAALPPDPTPGPPPDPLDDVFDGRRINMDLCCRILGLTRTTGRDDAVRVYRRLCLEHHPDRGGDPRVMMRILSAWAWYRSVRGW